MAVDADLVEDIAASIADIYREAESSLVALVTRHLNAGLDSPTAERRLGGIRALRRGAQAIISALEADSGPAIREALRDAYRHGWESALADLPEQWFRASGIGQAAREALKDIPGFGFVEALATALHADFGQVYNNVLRDVMDAYRSVQAAAAARILTGTQTRRQASQSAWQALTDRGLNSFTDRAGRRWRLSSYVEMAARTNAQRAATTAQVDRLDTLGVDLVYVSDSVQECPKCRPYEAKILRTNPEATGPIEVEHATRDHVMMTVDVVDTLAGARAAGLFHPNCRHSISAYLPGVTKLPAGPTEDPEGHKARTRQRELERRIRHQKERVEGALTPEAKKQAGARVRAAQADLREHLAANPTLKRLPYRERIGAGNIPPGGKTDDAAGGLNPPDEPTLDGGPAPAPPRRTGRTDPRDQPPAEDDRAPGAGQAELDDPRNLSDEELDEALMAAMADEFSTAEFERLAAEIDRREAEQRAAEERRAANREKARQRAERRDTERAERFRDLMDAGWDEEAAVLEVYGISIAQQRRDRAINELRGEGHHGRSFEELARASYRDYVYRQWLAAENATRGNLVTRAGQSAGIDPQSLFTGPESRARKWASDELKGWWDEHGRVTFEQWKAMLLGDSTEARRLREAQGGDFLA